MFVLSVCLASRAAAAGLDETEVKKLGTVPARDARNVTLSRDGERIAYVLVRGKERIVVTDGVEGAVYDEVRGLTFSPNGKYLAYAACKDRVWMPVVNGKEGERYTALCGPVFSPNGKHFTYSAARGRARSYVIFDGVQRTQFSAVGTEAPVFSPDSRHLAYEGRSSGTATRTTVRDPNRVRRPDERPPTFVTEDGKEVDVNSTSIERTHFIIRDEKKGVRTTDVKHPVFSPNSKVLVYCAAFDDKWFLVCDDSKYGKLYEDVGRAVFSPRGRTIAYAAKSEGKWCVVQGKKKGEPFDSVHSLTFSPNGKLLAYAARVGRKWFVVCEGKRSPGVDGIEGVRFSRDSVHLAYIARRRRMRVMIIDGVEGRPHGCIYLPKDATRKKDRLRCVVTDGGAATLVEVDWPAETTWKNALN